MKQFAPAVLGSISLLLACGEMPQEEFASGTDLQAFQEIGETAERGQAVVEFVEPEVIWEGRAPDGSEFMVKQKGEGCGSLFMRGNVPGDLDYTSEGFGLALVDWLAIEHEEERRNLVDLLTDHHADCLRLAEELVEEGRAEMVDYSERDREAQSVDTAAIFANCGSFYNTHISPYSTYSYGLGDQQTSVSEFKNTFNRTSVTLRACCDSFGLHANQSFMGYWSKLYSTWSLQDVDIEGEGDTGPGFASFTWPVAWDYRIELATHNGPGGAFDTCMADWVLRP
jgi:hypothetical protein